MTERAIQAGDLVCVVRILACGCQHNFGVIFRVTSIRKLAAGTSGECRGCGYRYNAPYLSVADGYANYGIGLLRLKRIPPLDSDELREIAREHEHITKEPAHDPA